MLSFQGIRKYIILLLWWKKCPTWVSFFHSSVQKRAYTINLGWKNGLEQQFSKCVLCGALVFHELPQRALWIINLNPLKICINIIILSLIYQTGDCLRAVMKRERGVAWISGVLWKFACLSRAPQLKKFENRWRRVEL